MSGVRSSLGQGLSLNTIIVAIVVVVGLAALIVFFTQPPSQTSAVGEERSGTSICRTEKVEYEMRSLGPEDWNLTCEKAFFALDQDATRFLGYEQEQWMIVYERDGCGDEWEYQDEERVHRTVNSWSIEETVSKWAFDNCFNESEGERR